jgi:hypothetical protein
MKTQRRALGRAQRKRNFAHMLRYAEDRQWLLAGGPSTLASEYLRHCRIRWTLASLEQILKHP